jgi:hypothetical protein
MLKSEAKNTWIAILIFWPRGIFAVEKNCASVMSTWDLSRRVAVSLLEIGVEGS